MNSYGKLDKYLRLYGLNNTVERTMMLDYIVALDRHFTLNELLTDFTATYHVSPISVRRNLDIFLRAEVVTLHHFPVAGPQYELTERAEGHYHRVCVQCGEVREFTDLRASNQIRTHRFRNFSIHSNQVTITGICKKCREQRRQLARQQNIKKPK